MLGNTIIARKGSSDASNIPQFVLSGLLSGEAPPTPDRGAGAYMKMLPIGYTTTMTTTQAYAIPNGRILMAVEGSGTLQLSNDNSTYHTTGTVGTTQVETAARFAKTTTGTLIVSCQKL